MELQEFYEHLEQHRSNVVDTAVKRYHSLTSLMGKVRLRTLQGCLGVLDGCIAPCKACTDCDTLAFLRVWVHKGWSAHICLGHVAGSQVEELVAGTNTGKSPQLAGYYTFWEQAVFNALIVMVLKGLDKLHSYMRSGQPLFKVRLAAHNEGASPVLVQLSSGDNHNACSAKDLTAGPELNRVSVLLVPAAEDVLAEPGGGCGAAHQGGHQAADRPHQECGRERQGLRTVDGRHMHHHAGPAAQGRGRRAAGHDLLHRGGAHAPGE
jgi:hypothetical protein